MGQRTYKEVGIIAREILGLKEQSSKEGVDGEASQESVSETSPGSGFVPPTEQEPEPEPDFGPAFESHMPDVSAFMDQPSFADIQLLDTNFDFCGLFDMNVPSMAAV